LVVDIEYEDATKTDAEIIGGLDDGRDVHDRSNGNSFAPNDDDE
jgi:hypothetical protein